MARGPAERKNLTESGRIGDLTLSEGDVARFQRCMRVLLAPLEHEHPDEWRSAVNRAVGPLFGADMVTFQLPSPDVELLYSDEVDVVQLRQYVPLLGDRYTARLSRAAELEVYNRRMIWGDDLEDFYESAYYHEFIVPVRGHDTLTAATRLDGAELPAQLYLHHERRSGPRFGERGLRLLRMLYPAFEAGTRAFHRFHEHRGGFFRTLDAVDEPVCVFDADGTLVHRNAGFSRLALSESDDEAVSAAVGELARSLAALYMERRSRGASRDSRVSRRVWAGPRTFTLEGSLVQGLGIGPRPGLVVTLREERRPRAVENGPPGAASVDVQHFNVREVAERHGLTPRQAEVAALVARRLTNREVAERLGISVHTVRHHVERVLAKLEVHSRRDVAAIIASPGEN